MQPLVSIILPTRNRSTLLRRSLASVLAQSCDDLEVIVVDDASTDDTPGVLAAIDDCRLRVIHNERNGGAAAARNAGAAQARGEWLAFQDDDDIWLNQKLEKQLAMLRANPGSAWCLCANIRLRPEGPRLIGGPRFIRQLDYRKGIGQGGPDWGLIATPGWLLRRALFVQAGGFDERIRSWDDWELGLRLSQLTTPIVIDEPLWLQDWALGSGLTRAERARSTDMVLIMQKHGELWKNDRAVLARHHYVIGRGESLYDGGAAGRRHLLESLRRRPAGARAWIALAMSYLPHRAVQAFTFALRRLRLRFK